LLEVGITALGDRLELLDATALCQDAFADPKMPSSAVVSEDHAERRQVAGILDVGSTTLSARMDPEDLREVVSDLSDARCGRRVVSVGSSPNKWATAYSGTSVIHRPCGAVIAKWANITGLPYSTFCNG